MPLSAFELLTWATSGGEKPFGLLSPVRPEHLLGRFGLA